MRPGGGHWCLIHPFINSFNPFETDHTDTHLCLVDHLFKPAGNITGSNCKYSLLLHNLITFCISSFIFYHVISVFSPYER